MNLFFCKLFGKFGTEIFIPIAMDSLVDSTIN
jgi:hypothetical protein